MLMNSMLLGLPRHTVRKNDARKLSGELKLVKCVVDDVVRAGMLIECRRSTEHVVYRQCTDSETVEFCTSARASEAAQLQPLSVVE